MYKYFDHYIIFGLSIVIDDMYFNFSNVFLFFEKIFYIFLKKFFIFFEKIFQKLKKVLFHSNFWKYISRLLVA